MIQITAYLRTEEDLKRWKEIGNKTQFLHDALHVQYSTLRGTMYPKVIKTPEQAKVLTEKILKKQVSKAEKASNLCEHFQVKGHCLVKGCKYS